MSASLWDMTISIRNTLLQFRSWCNADDNIAKVSNATLRILEQYYDNGDLVDFSLDCHTGNNPRPCGTTIQLINVEVHFQRKPKAEFDSIHFKIVPRDVEVFQRWYSFQLKDPRGAQTQSPKAPSDPISDYDRAMGIV